MELSLGEEADRGNGGACEVGVGVDAFRYGSGCGHECGKGERAVPRERLRKHVKTKGYESINGKGLLTKKKIIVDDEIVEP